jgi:hypothetical protein
MGDLDRELRALDTIDPPDLWDDIEARPPSGPVRTPSPRRRAAIAIFSLALSGAVLAWALVALNLRPAAERPAAVAAGERSATVLGVSMTYPSEWTLVDLWPLARSIASWPEPIGSSISLPEGTNERGGLPVLQLSNVDLGLRSVCGAVTRADEAVLYVAVNGGPYLLAGDGTPRWPGELTQDDGPCGPGWYAYRHSTEEHSDGTTGERPYLVFARFGPDASEEDQRVVFDAYDSLSFAPADILRPPAEESPRYVTPGTDAASAVCAGRSTIAADVDGDGVRDLVYHDWIDDRAVLGVCLGSGGTGTMEGAGQTEVLGVADVNADGRDEILYGGTSVSASYLSMAVWIDGALHQVRLPNGDPLMLTEGVEIGDRTTASGFGCSAQDGAGRGDISSATVEAMRDGLTWLRVDYELDAATATEMGSESGTAPVPADEGPMQDLATSLVSACPVTWR